MTQTTATAPAARNAAGGTSWVTSKDGTRIAYQKTGSGPPLILVMGALGSKDVSFAQNYAKELASSFTVYNYDRRGRGESGDTLPFALAREVEDLAALAAETGGSPHVFGLSSGAALALHAAAAGVPFAGVAAYEPPFMLPGAKNPPAADYEAHVKRLVAEGKRDEAVSYFMRTVGVPGFFVSIMKLMPLWKSLRSVAHTLPYDAAAMNGFKIPAKEFARIRVRTLVANGSKSPQSLQDSAPEVAKTIPGATHRVLPKQNHGVKPKAIRPVLEEFVKAA